MESCTDMSKKWLYAKSTLLNSMAPNDCHATQNAWSEVIYTFSSYKNVFQIWGTCIETLFWPPYEAKKWKLLFTSFFFFVYKNNSPSVKVWDLFYFYRCYGYTNGCQNRLKIGKWPFWSNFKTFDREINIEHKQIPKRYINRGWELSWHTIY